ncbi:hypothetical protein FE257_003414 [Aspergillus nanangensis]|uniref:Uncharacterized protein n=1 Tax=Aspergillus nanangensis TaxID=2582783 RepID=A0AAD4CBM9_ASPNN|nr:hypothetical protein FE257_003414 [Aspergillus nanangensis]
MTSLKPREPYSQEELDQLYPRELKLQLVQVFLRHGERTPVSSRFQNMIQMAAGNKDMSSWDGFQWHRKMEAFGGNDESVVAAGAAGEIEGICTHGELTDKGRETTFLLGERLRKLYIDQLGFMPKIKSDTEDMYLRATPIPRALESLQQAFWGMYPPSARTQDFPPPVIVARSVSQETLFPNEGNCRRFRQLARLFANRAALRWNESEQMNYINSVLSKWMPEASPRVAVDSHPRLSGIADTINASDAHGPDTRLPSEFYDPQTREYMNQIAVDEWFAGYAESNEYRKLGIGALMGDVVDRMVHTAVDGGWRSEASASGSSAKDGKAIRFAMSGCHDTTLAAILGSVGAFDKRWPPFTSSIAIELFEKPGRESLTGELGVIKRKFANIPSTKASDDQTQFETARAPLSSFPAEARQKLQNDYYVRIRYNDLPVRIPGCAAKPENHLPGNDTFCTLDAFKDIVDKFTPRNWQVECAQNTGEDLFGKNDKERIPAGF